MLIDMSRYEKLDQLMNEDMTFESVGSLYIKRPAFRERQVAATVYDYYEALHNGTRRIMERRIRFDEHHQMLIQELLVDAIPF